MKNTLLIALLISSSVMAHQPFHNYSSSHGLHNNSWSNFNKQFQQFNNKMRAVHNQNAISTQTKRYFDDQSNHYMIEIKVKGLAKENLDITTRNNMIYISGRVQISKKTANSSRTSSSKFSQSYSLPNDADTDNINAEFKNGILAVSIPKLEKAKPLVNKITIQ
ncbi:Hsp20/alpha crystallin family protein [Candidatus Thioglobus sp.]|nr:Hsp20/alpha crystallin family protein [Candidatus Thioglobus sp.]MDB3892817.1 Hsp20/alpha crystallin family protein [Candidatus Thioglobus sp.]MDC0919838.1 Hsp20/alpha crystallin family protein [Candidatus Thioglobus sp.]MDC0964759.1 Hsp20/alpha crystallin family protein [Candidatus Thioglobus sp.]